MIDPDETPRGSNNKIAAVETPEHLRPYAKLTDEQFASLLKAYRKAYDGQADPAAAKFGLLNPKDMSPQHASPTGSLASQYSQSSSVLLQPRHKNRATYVQRWKVMRDRNKSLPKLDFSAKANGLPKKFQGAPSFSRSYTYDSMKLPTISTCSVVTGTSGNSVHSEGYRRKDKKNLKEQSGASDSYSDIAGHSDFQDLGANHLSKSLQSLDERSSSAEKATNSKHRYERISYTKHLSNRHRSTNTGLKKEPTVLYKENTLHMPQGDKTGSKKYSVEKQFVNSKNQRKDRKNVPDIFNTLKREAEVRAKKGATNVYGYVSPRFYPHGTKHPSTDTGSQSETLTLTPDDVTAKSPPTTGVCSPKSTLTLSSAAHLPTCINMTLYDANLIAY